MIEERLLLVGRVAEKRVACHNLTAPRSCKDMPRSSDSLFGIATSFMSMQTEEARRTVPYRVRCPDNLLQFVTTLLNNK